MHYELNLKGRYYVMFKEVLVQCLRINEGSTQMKEVQKHIYGS